MGFLNMQPIANYFLPKIFLQHYNHSLVVYCQLNKFTIHDGIPDGETPSGRATSVGCPTHHIL